MGDFWTTIFGYPTGIYTALLGVVLIYWVLAIIGIVDFDHGHFDIHVHPHVDGDLGDIGVIASYMVALGLAGVPFSIVVSLIVLFAWTICALLAMWVLPLVPTAALGFVAGTLALVGSLTLALPPSAVVVRPLRKLFVTHNAISNTTLVGQPCRIVTTSVDEKFGRAEVATSGASVNIRVWAKTPNALTKGSVARVLDYDASRARYQVVAEK